MKEKDDYTVKTYYDITDEEYILRDSESFFLNKYSIFCGQNYFFEERAKIDKGEKVYICGFCKHKLRICGGKGNKKQMLHFRHYNGENKGCIYEEGKRLTQKEILCIKYNGAKESKRHEDYKNFIAERLLTMINPKLQEDEVLVEKVYRNECVPREWRKPDVLAKFPDKMIAFELQISTTFLSVITERGAFYQEQGIFIMWIFDNFSSKSEEQLFAQKDILVSNIYNVFVLDNDAMELSMRDNTIYLKCYYVDFYIRNGKIVDDKMISQLVSLSDLTFRKTDYKVFYVDAIEKRQKLEAELMRMQEDVINKRINEIILLLEEESPRIYYEIDNLSDKKTKEMFAIKAQALIDKILILGYQPYEKNISLAHFILQSLSQYFSQESLRRLGKMIAQEMGKKTQQSIERYKRDIDYYIANKTTGQFIDYYNGLDILAQSTFTDILIDKYKSLFFHPIEDDMNTTFYMSLLGNPFVWFDIKLIFEGDESCLFTFVEVKHFDGDSKQSFFKGVIYWLFEAGYRFSDFEERILKDKLKELNKAIKNNEIQGIKNEVFRYSLLLCYQRIQNKGLSLEDELIYYKLLNDNWIVISRIASVLMNFIIGCDLPNMASIADNIRNFYLEYAHLFILAAESDKGKGNKYRGKKSKDNLCSLKEYLSINPQYEKDYKLDKLIPIIFPNIEEFKVLEKTVR